jgi:hypothetical protein
MASYKAISTSGGNFALKDISNPNPSSIYSLEFSYTFDNTAIGTYNTGVTLPAGSMIVRYVLQSRSSQLIDPIPPNISVGTATTSTGPISTRIAKHTGGNINTGAVSGVLGSYVIPVNEPYILVFTDGFVTSGRMNVNLIYVFVS